MSKTNSSSLFFNYWLYLVAVLVFGTVALFSLRANNQQAVSLRNEVLKVDKANGDVEKALKELRKYIYSHMNTSLASGSNVYPSVQLKYRYERLVNTEKARVKAEMAKVYTEAQRLCEKQNSTDFSGRNRVPCIEKYVTSHSVTEQSIAEDLYKFAFASPTWSPDLAGISLLLTGLFAAFGVASFLFHQWLRGRLL